MLLIRRKIGRLPMSATARFDEDLFGEQGSEISF
jgi:hypothetical protein